MQMWVSLTLGMQMWVSLTLGMQMWVSQPHTRNANVSEPHTRNINVSEPHSVNDLCECEWASQGTPYTLALAKLYGVNYTPGVPSP